MITSHPYCVASLILLVGALSVALPTSAQTHKHTKEHDHSTHKHPDICAGFVVLPNGYAVLSAMEPTSGMPHDMRHSAGHGKAEKHHMAKTETMAHQAHQPHGTTAKGSDHGV
jgi:hypothetical protein